MNTADPVVNITIKLPSGAATFSDTNYDYLYYRLIVTGARASLVNITLNGATADLAGGTVIEGPIFSLVVNSGDGVLLFGTKSAKMIFGQYSSSSEGLV